MTKIDGKGTTPQNYEVKNVTSFKGTEGYGYNASLYRNRTRIAFLIDTANGGEVDIQWLDSSQPKVDITHTVYREGGYKPYTFKGTPEEKILYEHVDSLPIEPPTEEFPYEVKHTVNTFLGKLVEQYEINQKIKQDCKNKTVVKVDETYFTYNQPFSPQFKQFLQEKNPNITEFVNERFI